MAKSLKSAIRSKGTLDRQMGSQLFDATSSLMASDLSTKEFEFKQKERDTFYNTLYSGLELSDTISQSFQDKKELQSNIKSFEDSLPRDPESPSGKKLGLRKEEKTSLMDVFKREGKISDFLYGQDEYFVGEKSYGSKYDVAARGKQIKALDAADELLNKLSGDKYISKSPTKLGDFNTQLNFDYSKFNKNSNNDVNLNFEMPFDYSASGSTQDLRGQEEKLGFG
jgi:hypothetical protein